MGHDTVEGLPATVAHSRRAVGARRVPADYNSSTRLRPGRSGAHDYGFALAAVLTLGTFNGLVQAGGPPPVVVDSIEPAEIVQGQVPQPELQIFGSDFIEGLPSETNRPTVTLRQTGKGGAEFSGMAWVNFAGTEATLTADLINLLQAPLGVYDVIVTRPTDGASDTLEGAFTVTDGQPEPGEIALMVRSAWGGPVNDVEVVGNLAYAAIGRRLVILDVSTPSNPVEVGSLNIMAGVEGVAVRDGYAFLATHKPYRFTVVDVSDPPNPALVWAGQGASFSHDVLLYGDLAYVRSTGGHLRAFDITDPLNVQSFTIEGIPQGEVGEFVIIGDLLYVGTDDIDGGGPIGAELRIYDLAADPLNPSLLGLVDSDILFNGETTRGLSVEGNFAAWTVRVSFTDEPGRSFLHVVDISDPSAPAIVGTYDNGLLTEHILREVALYGGYAYVADATDSGDGTPSKWASAQGLVILDIAADPANPTVVSTFKTHGDVQGVQVVGNRAYLHDAGEGLIILDVSDPTNPVRLGNYHSPATLRQMDKVGDVLYVADAWNGFTILDVTDASHPQVLGVYLADHYNNLGVDARGIDVRDDLVYLGAGHLGLEVLDVSDPAYPALVGAFRIPSGVPACSTFAAVQVWGDDPRYASIGFEEHFCTGVGGILLNVDVTNPQDMFELGRISHGPPRASRIELNDQGIAFFGRSHPIYVGGEELTIDTSNPADPIIINEGDIHSPRMDDILKVADVALAGNTLFLAAPEDANYFDENDEFAGTFEAGLYIQDVTDPANPVVLLHLDETYPLGDGIELNLAYSIAVQNERAYLIGRGCAPPGGCGVQIAYLFDMAYPSTPLLLDAVSHVGGTNSAVLVDEPFVYVTNEFEGPNDPGIGLVVMEVVGLNPFGDIDGDGSVGASDLLILLASWGPCPPKGDCTADLNDDGSVGAADLLILLANWG